MLKQPLGSGDDAGELEIMASIEPWDMVTWKQGGIAVRHEFFLVKVGATENDEPHLKERIEQMNSRQMLGNGFKLKYFAEPELGCHVRVQDGWQLTNPVQSKLFLEQFMKLIA